MEQITTFSGSVTESVEEFFEAFAAVAVLKKCTSSDDKLLLLPSFLKGSALYFFRSIRSSIVSVEEVISKFKTEFDACDYNELFYNSRQDQKTLSEFYYFLLELASKANITKDSIFVSQFLKGLKPFYKNKLATSHFACKNELKEVIAQIEKLYPPSYDRQMNLGMNPAAVFMGSGGGGDQGPSTPYRTPFGSGPRPPTPFRTPQRTPSQDIRQPMPDPAPTTPRRMPQSHGYNLRTHSRPTTQSQPNFQPRQH